MTTSTAFNLSEKTGTNSDNSYVLVNFKLPGNKQEQSSIDAIVVKDGRIFAVGKTESIAKHYDKFDLQGLTISYGFIDLQLNGCGGVDFTSNISENTLDVMHETNLRSGCTTFLPTLISSSDENIRQSIDIVRNYKKTYPSRVLGMHLEGPYLNRKRKGIHNEAYIRIPKSSMIDFLCDNSDTIAMITLAPEVCPEGTIERLSEAGIIVSIGHTNANCKQVKAAEYSGASFATHLHNAMTPLNSREPGVVGAIFDSNSMGAGIIADGFHLSWENLRIAHKLLQDRLVLVTDATVPAGTDINSFVFAGQTIYHENGKCFNADGTLAGSALTMIKAVYNSVQQGIDFQSALRMATINAAKAIKKEAKVGSIAVDRFANFAIFDDHFNIHGTINGGHIQFKTDFNQGRHKINLQAY